MEHNTIINTIRHAHTNFAAEHRYAGSIDIPLSNQGRMESQEAALKIAGLQFDVVISSTLKRTVDTAQILVGEKQPILQSKLCVERNFGVFEGKTSQEVRDIWPEVIWIEVGNDLHSVNPKNSEPFEKVWRRAAAFRNRIFREYAGKNILIVSHGVFLQMLHGLLRGQSCIESLASYPTNLELYSFSFIGKRLINEKVSKLCSIQEEPNF